VLKASTSDWMERRHFFREAVRAALDLGVLALGQGADEERARGPVTPFHTLRQQYLLRALDLNPVIATHLGAANHAPTLSRVDGRLRDFRPDALDDEIGYFRGVRRELAAMDPAILAPGDRIDHRLMTAQVAHLCHLLEDLRHHEHAVDVYVAEPVRGIDAQLRQLTRLPPEQKGSDDEWQLIAARLAAVPSYLAVARQNLLAGRSAARPPDHRIIALDGLEGSRTNAAFFEALPEQACAFARPGGPAGPSAAVLQELERAADAAAQAFTAFGEFLQRTFPGADSVDRFAIGRPEYEWRLRNNLQEQRTTDELLAWSGAEVTAWRDLVFQQAERIAADHGLNLGFGTGERVASVRVVLDHLARDAPRDDAELLDWYRDGVRRAVSYGRDVGLFEVPESYQIEVLPTPAALRSAVDAAYDPAPPFGRDVAGWLYVTPAGDDAAALRLSCRASIADTAVHEGFPGHDWHYRCMHENRLAISAVRWFTPGGVDDSASMWLDAPAVEGWALYAEELMAESAPERPHGFYSQAEYLHELLGQLLRAARVRIDVALHTGVLSFDQAVDELAATVEFMPDVHQRAATDPAARAVIERTRRAIYRYAKWPTQAVTYSLGRSAILSCRDAARTAAGPAFDPRRFHDALMRAGPIPIAFFREELLAEAAGTP
jgi:uncharacterized protein (DUF885 family)